MLHRSDELAVRGSSLASHTARGLAAALVACALLLMGHPAGALATGSFPNAKVADLAESWWNANRSAANPAPVWPSGNGQCIDFAETFVNRAFNDGRSFSGAIANGYYNVYSMRGGQEVSLAQAQRGDIIQLSPTSSSWYGNGHQHTAIVLGPYSAPTKVIDANWYSDTRVREHSLQDVINWKSQWGLKVAVWRFGTWARTPPSGSTFVTTSTPAGSTRRRSGPARCSPARGRTFGATSTATATATSWRSTTPARG